MTQLPIEKLYIPTLQLFVLEEGLRVRQEMNRQIKQSKLDAKWKQECLEEMKVFLIHHALRSSFLASFIRCQIHHSTVSGAKQ